jgi:hypothetical protein
MSTVSTHFRFPTRVGVFLGGTGSAWTPWTRAGPDDAYARGLRRLRMFFLYRDGGALLHARRRAPAMTPRARPGWVARALVPQGRRPGGWRAAVCIRFAGGRGVASDLHGRGALRTQCPWVSALTCTFVERQLSGRSSSSPSRPGRGTAQREYFGQKRTGGPCSRGGGLSCPGRDFSPISGGGRVRREVPLPMSDIAWRALLSQAGLPVGRRRLVRVRARARACWLRVSRRWRW